MDRSNLAVEIFRRNSNCAQAVFSVFADDGGIEQEKALRIASCFGGGMRCGEVCGAVTGALMAMGLQYGYSSVEDPKDKLRSNALALAFEEKFREMNQSIICRELLGYDLSKPEEMTKLVELGLFDTLCPKFVADATDIAEQLLEKQK